MSPGATRRTVPGVESQSRRGSYSLNLKMTILAAIAGVAFTAGAATAQMQPIPNPPEKPKAAAHHGKHHMKHHARHKAKHHASAKAASQPAPATPPAPK